MIFLVSLFEAWYIGKKSVNLDIKKRTVKLLTMPDLALCNEAFYIRDRSLASVGDAFSISPSLLSYFPSDFVYNHADKR